VGNVKPTHKKFNKALEMNLSLLENRKTVICTKVLFIILFLLFYSSPLLIAQTGIDDINASYTGASSTSYDEGGDTYTYGVVPSGESGNNLILSDFQIDVGAGVETFDVIRLADRINIFRVDNSNVSGEKQLLFYENGGSSGSNINLRPGFLNTMEEVLLNETINRGTDNVFANTGGTNNNNIERIDFIFDDGLVVPTDLNGEGFTVMERNGNDDFKIAAITSLDSNGDPDGFGTVLDVVQADWGGSQFSFETEVLSSDTPADNLERTASVGTQTLSGVFVSYGDLGFSTGDQFFGYALAGGDASTNPADWPTANNFPTNTDAGSQGAGGMDLLAGGSVSSRSNVEISVDLTGGPCWRMLSAPSATTYANLLSNLWTQGVPGSDSPPPETASSNANVLVWPNDVSGVSPTDWVTPTNLTDPIPAGTGFIVSVFEDDDFSGTVETEEEFPKTITATGTANSGSISPTLNSTNSSAWTLVGNPYDVPVDFDLLTKSDLTNVAYVYDRNASGITNGNSGGWQTTNGSVGDLKDGVIAPMQGFFIQNSGGSPSLTFEEADQTTGGEFYGKEDEINKSVLRFQLTGEELINSAWLTFSESGSNQLIPGDALELTPFSTDYATLAFNKSGEELLDIAQFPGKGSIEIPFHAESTIPGNYSIEITDFDLNPGINLTLIDNQTGEEVPVTKNFKYEFEIQGFKKENSQSIKCNNLHDSMSKFKPNAQKAIGEHRFSIIVDGASETEEVPTEVGLNQNYPNPFNPTTQISYQIPQQGNVLLEVYDMAGRKIQTLVDESVAAGSYQVNFDASNLSSGVYVYRLQTGSQVLSRKLTVIK
jgi:hypothetical protein